MIELRTGCRQNRGGAAGAELLGYLGADAGAVTEDQPCTCRRCQRRRGAGAPLDQIQVIGAAAVGAKCDRRSAGNAETIDPRDDSALLVGHNDVGNQRSRIRDRP